VLIPKYFIFILVEKSRIIESSFDNLVRSRSLIALFKLINVISLVFMIIKKMEFNNILS
jgi:hypothetical protein